MSTASDGRNKTRGVDPASDGMFVWFNNLSNEEKMNNLHKWHSQNKSMERLKEVNYRQETEIHHMTETHGKLVHTHTVIQNQLRQMHMELENKDRLLRDKMAYDKELMKQEYSEFVGILAHLEESLAFIPRSPEGGPIEGRLLTIIQSFMQRDSEMAKKEAEMKHLKAELDLYKNSVRDAGLRNLLSKPSNLDGDNKDTVKLQAELEIARKELAELEATLQDRDQTVARLTEERDTARTNVEEAKAKEEVLYKDAQRAHKAKSSAQDARNKVEAEFKKLETEYRELEVRYNSRDRENKLDHNEVTRLRNELEAQKKSYEKVKTLPRLDDVKKIKSLNKQLEEATSRIGALEMGVKEKETLLEANRTKVQKVDDEKNEALKRLGHLQEELAKKDVELSKTRLKVGGLESSIKIIEKERDAESRKAKQDLEMTQHELVIARKKILEREKDIEFWKASIANQEKKAEEQTLQIQSDFKAMKDANHAIDVMRMTLTKLQGEIETLQDRLQSHEIKAQNQRQTIRQQQEELDKMREKVKEFETADIDRVQMQEHLDTLRNKIHTLAQGSIDAQVSAGHDPTPAESNLSLPSVSIFKDDQPCSQNGKVLWTELVRIAKVLIEIASSIHDVRSSYQRNQNHRSNPGEDHSNEAESKIQDQVATHQRAKHEWESLQDQLRKENERLLEQLSDQEQQLQELAEIKSMFGPGSEGTDRQVEYFRAFAGIDALEEMITEWESIIKTANGTRDYMLSICEEQAQQILQLRNQKADTEEKITRVERDLERCREDLESATTNLVQCKGDAQEEKAKADELEKELQSYKHKIIGLEQSLADQNQQLDGQARAQKRLDSARKTYDQIYESKIKRLQEEKTTSEALFHAELVKRNEAYIQEINKLKGDQESGSMFSKDEFIAAKTECEFLKSRLEQIEQDKIKITAMVTEYRELVESMQNDRNPTEETLAAISILSHLQESQETIESLRIEVGALTESNEGLNQLLKVYQDDTTKLTIRTESYLDQIRQFEAQMQKLRQELGRTEITIRTLQNRNQALERELKEQIEAAQKTG
ncbi:hypothetical protein FBU30_008286 [Linnemannia zychae]|nr:hypothetical protein FBU30_008286 [Linnemannia zychae]